MSQVEPSGRDRAHAPASGGIPTGISALRELRLRRFWTQADLAAAFEARSRQIGRPLSLSVRQVRRWESENPPLPLPAYQAVLEALFGVSIERMGFQPEWVQSPSSALAPLGAADPSPGGGTTGGQEHGGSAADGGAGVARSPKYDHGRQDPVKRRDFMVGTVALGSGPLVGAVPPAVRRGPANPGARPAEGYGANPAPADGYAVITAQHRALYWSVPATALFQPVAAHCELGLGLAGAAGLRARLAAPLAESAMLAGRLAFFDLRHPDLAEKYYLTALDAAREAADRPLTAAVLTHLAFVPAYAGHARRARELMAEAHRQAGVAAGTLQRSWMHAVEAEVEAKLGNAAACVDLISRAEGDLGARQRGWATDAPPEWFDFYDESRLAGFKGFCQLYIGRSGEAALSLELTLRALPKDSAKQRSVILADLAQARAQEGEYEESARLLRGAIEELDRQWYAIGAERVDGVRRVLGASCAPTGLLAPLDEARRHAERTYRRG